MNESPLAFLQKVVANNSAAPLVFIVLAACTWLIGGNLLVAKHYRRVGKSPWSGFKPFAFPFFHFNGREWGILLFLAVLTFAFALTGLLLNVRGGRH